MTVDSHTGGVYECDKMFFSTFFPNSFDPELVFMQLEEGIFCTCFLSVRSGSARGKHISGLIQVEQRSLVSWLYYCVKHGCFGFFTRPHAFASRYGADAHRSIADSSPSCRAPKGLSINSGIQNVLLTYP